MKILVIHPKVCSVSAKEIAEAIGADRANPWDSIIDYKKYDVVFNLGCNKRIPHKNVINTPIAVATCIDKVKTFEVFKKAKVPTVNYRLDKNKVPKSWDVIVVRQEIDGNRAKNMDLIDQGDPIPDGALFTEYFYYDHEYRIVVFRGKVVGRYEKTPDGLGNLDMVGYEEVGFEEIDAACLRGAEALGIDYVGFDVVYNVEQDKFAVLEANSGAMMFEEPLEAIVQFFKEQK